MQVFKTQVPIAARAAAEHRPQDADPRAQLRDMFLGRQPILDRRGQVAAYELLFRSGRTPGAQVSDDMAATTSVALHAFSEFGAQEVLGRHKGYINVNAEFLLSDMVHALPCEQVVLELLETIVLDRQVVERCAELKALGFSLALDDVTEYREEFAPLLGLVDVVKLDLLQIEAARMPDLVRRLKSPRVSLLAEKVETQEKFQECLALGFDLFQGYYFARPQVLAGQRLNPGKLALLQVLALVLNDAETEAIERELKRHPDLTFNLLRLVNSAASGLRHSVSSLKQAIVVLGRRQIQRWIQLLLYASPKGSPDPSNPLMQLAAGRARLMEIIAGKEQPADRAYQDKAFLVGILSLLGALLRAPLSELLEQLTLPEDAKSALLERGGPLGRLLQLAEALEVDDQDGVASLLASIPGLESGDLMRAEVEALAWAGAMAETAA
jgi:c-di-GMP-related signal transduction protein